MGVPLPEVGSSPREDASPCKGGTHDDKGC